MSTEPLYKTVDYWRLPIAERRRYWYDYLNRLVSYSLSNADELTSMQQDQLLAETKQVLSTIKLLSNHGNYRTFASAATPKPKEQGDSILALSPTSNPNIRTRRKLRPARRRNREDSTARANNS